LAIGQTQIQFDSRASNSASNLAGEFKIVGRKKIQLTVPGVLLAANEKA
jgi:hypothetical protein